MLALCICLLAACQQEQPSAEQTEQKTEHVHVPDDANCSEVQHCADCGEFLAEQGEHVYPAQPDSEQDGFAYFVCTVCGHIKIVNLSGAPVVPVE
jgi:hypothetical protein